MCNRLYIHILDNGVLITFMLAVWYQIWWEFLFLLLYGFIHDNKLIAMFQYGNCYSTWSNRWQCYRRSDKASMVSRPNQQLLWKTVCWSISSIALSFSNDQRLQMVLHVFGPHHRSACWHMSSLWYLGNGSEWRGDYLFRWSERLWREDLWLHWLCTLVLSLFM